MLVAHMRLTAVAIAACSVLTLPAFAEILHYTADLTAGAEVPPSDSKATGTADVTVDTDTNAVIWTVTVQDLTGDPTAAHIHGPASITENAPPVVDMSEAIMQGTGDITPQQMIELEEGKYYVNVHTEKFPDGEIRGQLQKVE